MKRYGGPEVVVTDKLRSYGAAMKVFGNADRQETGRWCNNQAENSYQPFRRRERTMIRFRCMRTLQKFVAVHASIHHHFNQDRSLSQRDHFKANRTTALAVWRGLCALLKCRVAGLVETSSHSSDSTRRRIGRRRDFPFKFLCLATVVRIKRRDRR